MLPRFGPDFSPERSGRHANSELRCACWVDPPPVTRPAGALRASASYKSDGNNKFSGGQCEGNALCNFLMKHSARMYARPNGGRNCESQSNDFISPIRLVRLALASPKSIMHFS